MDANDFFLFRADDVDTPVCCLSRTTYFLVDISNAVLISTSSFSAFCVFSTCLEGDMLLDTFSMMGISKLISCVVEQAHQATCV